MKAIAISLFCLILFLAIPGAVGNEAQPSAAKNDKNSGKCFCYLCDGYKVKEVVRIIDGDTLDLLLDLGFGITYNTRVRLYGIDTPEIRGVEKQKGRKATERLKWYISKGDVLILEKGIGKYGRPLAVLYVNASATPINVNEQLVKEGFAKPYFGGKKKK